ncbi:MAG: four helix bundle protein [Patescibacteria group bacterium]
MNQYQEKLKSLMNEYVHFVYKITRGFPKEELYGVTSQFRRAAMSVALNYIEGFARFRTNVKLNFFEIAYGSFKESAYLLDFSLLEKYISLDDYTLGKKLADEIGAMLWTEVSSLQRITSK